MLEYWFKPCLGMVFLHLSAAFSGVYCQGFSPITLVSSSVMVSASEIKWKSM